MLVQGGAHGQFAGVPLNLCGTSRKRLLPSAMHCVHACLFDLLVSILLSGDKHKAQYVDGGFWSRRAASEASKYCTTAVCASTYRCPVTGRLRYPDPKDWCVQVAVCIRASLCDPVCLAPVCLTVQMPQTFAAITMPYVRVSGSGATV